MEGEDEASPNQDSFSEKTAWQRFSIIIAGPIMNFILALILFFGLNAFTGVPSLTISEVIDGPAKEAGIVAGDKVLEIDSQKIKNWQDLVNAIDLSDDKVEVLVEKASGGQQAYTLEPMVEEGVKLIGIVQGREKSFFGAFKYAVSQILSIFGSFFTFFSRLFTGQGSSDDVAGPLGLVKLVDEVTKAGFYMVVFFTAFFSMNLGVMNLLPIPALDGGRLLFIIVELVRGKPLDPDKEGMIHFAGFVFLMLVMVFVTFLDIQKWIN